MPTYQVTDDFGRTLKLTGDSPPTEEELELIFADLPDPDPFADERTGLGQAGETLKAIPRGFANTFLSAGEGLGELADAATNVVGLENVIDDGDDNALVAASREGRLLLDEYMGADEAYRDTWLTKFGEGVGSMASFFTPAGVLRLAGLAGKPVAALGGMSAAEATLGGTLAAGAGAGDQAQRIQAARDAGIEVSENQEDMSVVGGGFVGLSELALPATLFKRLDKGAFDGIAGNPMEMLKSALRSGSTEAIQEVTASIAQNAIEKGVYNENLELLGGNLYDDLTIGGAVGAGADLVMNAVAGRRNKISFDSELGKERKALEQREKDIASRAEILSRDLELDPQFQEILRQEREAAPGAEEERSRIVRERVGMVPINEQTPIEDSTYAIKQLMGIYFPSAQSSFSVRSEPLGEDGVKRYQVVDSDGYTYGAPSETQGRAAALASSLNRQIQVDAVYNGGDAVIQSSPEAYSDDQKRTLQSYNFAANSPEEQTYTSVALDSAAETTLDRGFYEGEKLNDVIRDVRAGVRQEARMTASQKLNAKRMEQGKAPTNNFTLAEVKDVLGDKLVNLTDTRVNGLPETETYRVEDRRKKKATVPNYVVVSSAGEVVRGRKLTPKEKQDYLDAGKPKKNMPRIVPFARNAGEAQAFADQANANTGIGRVDESVYRDKFVSRQFLENILDAKNITSPIDSPELKYLAERFAGVKPRTNLSQMTEGEFKLFAQKLRSLPRFDSPTKLPVFKLKPYTGYQFKKAVEVLQANPSINDFAFAEEVGVTDAESAAQLLSDVKEQGIPEVAAPTPLALPAPAPVDTLALDQFNAAMEREMKGLGLSDVPVNVDYALRSSSRDSDGNVVYGIRPRQPGEEVAREDVVGGELGSRTFVRQEEADPEGKAVGLMSQGYFSPSLNRIFLSIDAIKTDPSMTQEQVEAALVDTLNHESIHAMRMMDLFKKKEWSLLSKKAKELKKSGNQTYLDWARATYKELNPVQQNEEAVAELVRDQRANQKLVVGKPRALINRIKRFMSGLKNALDGSGFTSFEAIIDDIGAGRIGGRSREVRTLQYLERTAGLAPYAATGTVSGPRGVTTGEEEGREGQPRMADFSRRPAVTTEPVEMGVNVRTDGDINYADLIVSGQKKYESRDKDSLRPYVGKRIGIVETGSGPAKLVGYATVGEPIEVGEAEFDDSRDQHLVPEGSKFDIKSGQSKFLYEMINPEQLAQPIDASGTKGIVARNISQLGDEDAPSFSRRALDERSKRKVDTTVDPEVEDAYKKLMSNEITRSEYDTIVLGTIGPYDSVPDPATEAEMIEGLRVRKQKEKVNAPVDEGLNVGLRLDINAYLNNNPPVWVPTIHQIVSPSKQPPISHKATASITNADFTKTPQGKAQKVMEGGVKGPFATINGQFANRTDAENKAIAEQAINDPAWTQVGFNPRKHSYFYDRKTGEPVTFADEVVQVGPLVLAKNATKGELPGGEVFETLYSRTTPLSPLGQAASMGMTNTDLLPTQQELKQMKDNTYKPEKKRTLVEAAQLLQDRWEAATGRTTPFEYTEENIGILSDMLASEALVALENDSNAIGWYDRKIKTAKKVMGLVEPAIMQSPESEAVFDFGLAVTSNGQAVVDNFEMATDMFRFHQKNGRFPETKKEFDKGGERNAAMLEAFKFHNEFSKSGQNQALRDFLDEDFTVRDLSAFADDFNAQVGFDAIKVPSAEGADVVVKGSYILGPKIGQGFYQNIRGNYDPLTMDIWWMRMWNRAIGRPFVDGLDDSARNDRRDELKALVKKSGGLPKQLVNEVLKGNDQTRTEIYQDPDMFDDFIRDLERRYQRFYKDYKIEKGVNHTKPEIFKKTGTYVKNLKPQLQATPKGVVERAYMREVVEAARERLRDQGYDITTADFQALMWYPEKQLFRALGVQPGRGSDNDYLDAAEILAEKEGVPRGKVEKALRDADRERTVDDKPSARRQDGAVRGDAARFDGQEEGPAFSRRAPTLASKQIPEGQVKQTVERNIEVAENAPAGYVPKFNPSSDPYAQAVAADPDKGAVLPPEERAMFSRALAPERPESVQEAMDSMLIANPEDLTPGETYLNVLEQGPIEERLTRYKQSTIFQYAQLEAYKNKFDREVLASSAAIPALMAADRSNAITAQAISSGIPVYENGLTKVVDFNHTFTEGSDRAGETQSFRGLIDVMGMLFTKQHGSLEEDAQAYAIARRAEGLRQRGIESPGTPEQHAMVIRNAEQYLDENGRSIIKDWYDAWQGYNRNTIKFLRDTGVLTEKMAEIWAAQSDYVPFYRQAEGEATPNVPNIFGGLTALSSFKKIKGSEKQLSVPLLDAITMNLSAAVDMGMKNVAQQRVVRDMVRYGLSSEIPAGEAIDGRPTVTFRVGGKDRKFTIEDPLVYQSLQPLAGSGFDSLETVLGAPANLLRETVTRMPGFIMANMMRDTLSAYVTSGANFVPIASTLKGFTQDMQELERAGVVGGYDYSKDPKDIGSYLNKIMKERGYIEDSSASITKPFVGLWNFMGNVTTRSDFATRKAVYDDVLARTGDEAEAVWQAKEVMNFARRGAHPVMRVLTTAIPFLNARLQGLDLLLNSARGKRNANKNLDRAQAARSFIFRGATIAAMTSLYYMLVSDDEQYQEQTEEIKDNFWIIPGPNGVAFRYPIPFEVGLLFKTIPERALRYATGDATGRETLGSLGRGVVSTLEINPFGVQAVAPAIEVLANYSAYTGRNITPVFVDQGEAQEFQETIGTTEVAKMIGQVLGVSPIKTEYLIKGYTGTLGAYILEISDLALRSKTLQGDNRAVLPTMKITEYPFFKRFFTREFGGAEKERFYEMSNYINRFYKTYNDLAEDGRLEELHRFSAGREHLLGMKRSTDMVRRDLASLRKEKAAITRMDLSSDEKERLIRDINLRERFLLEVVPELSRLADLPTIDVGSRLRGAFN